MHGTLFAQQEEVEEPNVERNVPDEEVLLDDFVRRYGRGEPKWVTTVGAFRARARLLEAIRAFGSQGHRIGKLCHRPTYSVGAS